MAGLIDILWDGMVSGDVQADFPDLAVDEGQRLQLDLLRRWESKGERLAGYKIGLTSGAARNAFGEGVRPFGFILRGRVLQSGESVDHDEIGHMGVENELVFRVSRAVKTDSITAVQAREIVDAVAPGFEINQHRIRSRTSNGIRVADNLSQWGIVVGDFVSIDQEYENLVVGLTKDGDPVQEVAASGHIDDHFESIAALARRLYRFDRGLDAGSLIITGSFTRQPAEEPAVWCGDFGVIGRVGLEVI